ncbi:DNAH [Mytilus coruscus]|uniref:DNAH n=1 Tax=Mytilus coruscus TaxID=42192 RepID=A0A6J8DR58_MYTCO|nr:DNAH [Mytilus coruscus]
MGAKLLQRIEIRWGPEADSVINLEYGLLEICFDGIDNNFLKHITNLYYLFPLQSLYREYSSQDSSSKEDGQINLQPSLRLYQEIKKVLLLKLGVGIGADFYGNCGCIKGLCDFTVTVKNIDNKILRRTTLSARIAALRKMVLSETCFHGVGIRLGGLIQLIQRLASQLVCKD